MQVRAVRQVAASSRERVRCVIVENGSLPLDEAGTDGYDETVVIAQMKDELPGAFGERVTSRLASLERAGKTSDAALVLVGSRNDAASSASRRRVMLVLCRYLRAGAANAEVTLMTQRGLASEQHAELLDLAEAMLALPSPLRVLFKLRFGQPRAA